MLTFTQFQFNKNSINFKYLCLTYYPQITPWDFSAPPGSSFSKLVASQQKGSHATSCLSGCDLCVSAADTWHPWSYSPERDQTFATLTKDSETKLLIMVEIKLQLCILWSLNTYIVFVMKICCSNWDVLLIIIKDLVPKKKCKIFH